MKTIFKYPLATVPVIMLHLPKGARFLCVAEQNDAWYLWAEIDPNSPTVERKFLVFGTGQPIPEDIVKWYIGTIHMHNGYVWHIYEELPKEAPSYDHQQQH